MILSGRGASVSSGSRRWSLASTSMPPITRPKTVCLPSRCGVGTKVRKNCEPPRVGRLGLGHAQAAAEVQAVVGPVAFAGDRVARPARAVALRIAPLGHEAGEHAVERQSVVEAASAPGR